MTASRALVPADFMFQFTEQEFDDLRSRSVISSAAGTAARRPINRHDAIDGLFLSRYRVAIYSPLDQPPGLRRGFVLSAAGGKAAGGARGDAT